MSNKANKRTASDIFQILAVSLLGVSLVAIILIYVLPTSQDDIDSDTKKASEWAAAVGMSADGIECDGKGNCAVKSGERLVPLRCPITRRKCYIDGISTR